MSRGVWRGLSALVLGLSACGEGSLGEGRRLEVDGGTNPSDGAGPPDGQVDAGPGIDAAPADTGAPQQLSASAGSRCQAGVDTHFLVLSLAPVECAAHAEALDHLGDQGTVFAAFTPPTRFPADLTLDGQSCSARACQSVPLTVHLTRYAPGAGAAGTYDVTLLDGRHFAGDLDAQDCAYPAADPPLASDVRVDQLALYQAVKVTLVEGGAPVGSRNGPVIAGRPGVLRVFVTVDAAFTARPILGRVTLSRPDGSTIVKQAQRTIDRDSTDAAFDSTFNLELEAGELTADTSLTVSLLENDACTPSSGDTRFARFPAQGNFAVGAEIPGSLEVVLVPVRYQADGSNRVPNIDAAMLASFREDLWKQYPLAELNLSVRPQPMDWNSPILADSTGWGDFLSGLLAQRNADQPADDVYYYGVVMPAGSREEYCPNTCIGGVSLLPDSADTYGRGAVGIGFDHPRTFDTLSHELGHAHGRQHSGCMSPDNDPAYPYPEGQIGSWGYDITQKGFKAPALRDFMGYCTPAWISDYNYRALYERIRAVNLAADLAPGAPTTYRVALWDRGGLRWGRPLTLRTPPRGHTVTLRYLDAQGATVATTSGSSRAYGEDHLGQMVLVGPGPTGAVAVEVGGLGRLSLE